MAKATFNGRECEVRADRDLDENWAVSILSGEIDPNSVIQRPVAPLVMKVRATTRWIALETVLKSLKEAGRISDFVLEPRPAEELAAIEAEKAKAAAKKAAAPAGKAAPAASEE